MNWAHVTNGTIDLLTVADTSPGDGWVRCTVEGIHVGWTWDGWDFMAPVRTKIPAGEFQDRFTAAEQVAVQTLASTDSAVALGLTMGLARGEVDLLSDTAKAWVQRLVAGGAITADRAVKILEPGTAVP